MVITKIGQIYSFFLTLATATINVSTIPPLKLQSFTQKNKTALKNKETVLNSLSATQKRGSDLIMKKILIILQYKCNRCNVFGFGRRGYCRQIFTPIIIECTHIIYISFFATAYRVKPVADSA